MKAKVLNILAEMPFEIVVHTMKAEGCDTLAQLAAKISKWYTKEDVRLLARHLKYAYDCFNRNNQK